ncbi:MAG: helix-turn-helix transcriptional regulator [Halapricum sp.]
MAKDRNPETGTFVSTADKRDIVRFFKSATRPFQTATDIADHFGISRTTAHRRLEDLQEEGTLKKEKVGARAVVWWLPDEDDNADGSDTETDDPFLTASTFSSGRTDVSGTIDEEIAAAAESENADR